MFYQQHLEVLTTYIQSSKVLASAQMKAFAQALVTNRMELLSVRPGASGAKCMAVELLVHLAAVLLCGNQGILAPLQQIALAPANMQVCRTSAVSDNYPLLFEVNLMLVIWLCRLRSCLLCLKTW